MMEFSPEYIKGLKKQARQYHEDAGIEWRGRVIPLCCLDPSTGCFRTIDLDFRDEAEESEDASDDL